MTGTKKHTRTKSTGLSGNAASRPQKQINEKLILVYAGAFSAFRIKEFKSWEPLIRFVTANELNKDEFAVLQGSVVRITRAYRDDKS